RSSPFWGDAGDRDQRHRVPYWVGEESFVARDRTAPPSSPSNTKTKGGFRRPSCCQCESQLALERAEIPRDPVGLVGDRDVPELDRHRRAALRLERRRERQRELRLAVLHREIS